MGVGAVALAVDIDVGVCKFLPVMCVVLHDGRARGFLDPSHAFVVHRRIRVRHMVRMICVCHRDIGSTLLVFALGSSSIGVW